MRAEQTGFDGLVVLVPRRFGDDRGFFCESWNKRLLAEHRLHYDFVQDNYSLSRDVGTVRGLHFQAPPHAQDKLVRCGAGAVLDVAVDARAGSPTYGKWVAVELSAENGKQLLIPKGFLHGFATLKPDSELLYKCSDVYAPACDGAVHFADPDLGIDWGLDPAKAVLSDKDRAAQSFRDFKSPFTYEG